MTVTDSTRDEERGREEALRLFTVSMSLLWIDGVRLDTEFYLRCTIPLPVLHSVSAKESRNCMNVQFVRFAKFLITIQYRPAFHSVPHHQL